jgi:cysteine desulfurase
MATATKRIYLDHAATTAVRPEVMEVMRPYFDKKYGNASSLHAFGREASEALEKARESVAKHLGAKPEEVFFVSSEIGKAATGVAAVVA